MEWLALRYAIQLTLLLSLWGFVLSVSQVLPYLWVRYGGLSVLTDIDYAKKEMILNPKWYCRNMDGSYWSKSWCGAVDLGEGIATVPVVIMSPCVVWLLYYKMKRYQWIAVLGTQVVMFWVLQMAVLESQISFWLVGSFLVILPQLLFKWIFPSDWKTWKVSLFGVAISNFAVGIVLLFNLMKTFINDMVFLLLILPLFRVIILGMARTKAKILMTDGQVNGETVQTRREFGWIFLLQMQIFFATWARMIVTRIEDDAAYFVFVFGNMAQELLFRHTVSLQDRMIKKIMKHYCKASPKKRVVVSPVHGGVLNHLVAQGSMDNLIGMTAVDLEWYAFVAVGDMVAEFIGLFTNLGLLILFHDAILGLPLPAYAVVDQPFDEPMPIKSWVRSTFIQVIAELCVDCLSLFLEQHWHKFPIKAVWNAKSFMQKMIMFYVAACIGTGVAIFMLRLAVSPQSENMMYIGCNFQNLCDCPPAPLPNTYAQYCQRIRANATSH